MANLVPSSAYDEGEGEAADQEGVEGAQRSHGRDDCTQGASHLRVGNLRIINLGNKTVWDVSNVTIIVK